MLAWLIRFFLENKPVAYLLLGSFVVWGLVTAPFDFGIEQLPRDPVSVDAIPDIGENQQIVFTKWMGRSPQDIEDQITYPLTTALLGIPGVKSIRSNSMFGFSTIYVIFDDDIEFYWSRSRILEKLNALPPNTLPLGIQASLGPDATALGQIFWYTLEGRDKEGKPTGGWDLHELRTIQDFYVRYGLSSAEGVAEVASIGGFVKEYQVEVDPIAMKANNITLAEVMKAIKESNIDVGAQTIEINLAEYFVRGLGYIKNIEDIEKSVVKVNRNVPIRIGDIARVNIAPAPRRGVLDKSGTEAVGGVVVARYGANPLTVIQNVKAKMAELAPGLASKMLSDSTFSQVTIVPFYDRTQLINETVGTIEEALTLEILITIIVVILMLFNLKSSLLVAGTLPVSVLMCFIAMKYFGVDANIVALSGIAIAIGTMVDMGIVLTESMVKRMKMALPEESLLEAIYAATIEVAPAVLTAVATTIVSFLPVFAMEAAEGKLFRPLAFTKTFALIASIIVAITIIPALAHSLFALQTKKKIINYLSNGVALVAGIAIAIFYQAFLGTVLITIALIGLLKMLLENYHSARFTTLLTWLTNIVYALFVAWILAGVWMPLGVNKSTVSNFLFVVSIAGGLLSFFYLIIYFYERILRFLLRVKILFLLIVGLIVYQGFVAFQETGQEFMPALDEGSFLLMPTAMPHAGMQENIKNLRLLDMAVTAIPEVETVVGKAGRINSALDPAPMSMYENVILYRSEYKTNAQGHRLRFKYEDGAYQRSQSGELIPDKNGRYYRQWRDEIKSPDDIWNEIVRVTKIPGLTSAPKLQPIETRLVMLQTGMRAPMGIKVRGTDLATIEAFGITLEKELKTVKGVKTSAVFADRIVGKPYLLLDLDRDRMSRYGLTIETVQSYIQTAIGGMTMTNTVEGRERYAVKIRYPRALRSDPEVLKEILLPTATGQQVPLGDVVTIRYEKGAQAIKSEDGFLIGFVLFDREEGYAEVELVEKIEAHLQKKIAAGTLTIPAGVNYRFAGNYEQQLRANKRLSIVVPIALIIIFLILYFQFQSVAIAFMVFTGVFIAFAGGFLMIGWYDTDWFLNIDVFGTNLRTLFQIKTINLSVAVWVGFLALFGIATDDGVLVATFLQNSFKRNEPTSIQGIRDAVVEGGMRRVRPAMMTTATTILALLPILSATGRGADIMLPMAVPSFGGMSLQIITMFTVPVLYALWQEWRLRWQQQIGRRSLLGKSLMIGFLLCVASSFAQAQSLADLKKEALENNLTLQALETDYLAALEKAPQQSQLPDPTMGIGVAPLPIETRLGSQWLRVSAQQMIPWFGTLTQRKNLALAKAEALKERVGVRRLNINYQIEKAYYQLYEVQQRQVIIRANLQLFQRLERLALAKVESGKATGADVLRVQLKLEALEQELAILATAQAKPMATLNQLLQRTANRPIVITDSLRFAVIPFSKAYLMNAIRSNHPALRQFELQQTIAEEALALNVLDGKPGFGLGVDYLMINKRTDASPANNGRDVLQLRASIRLPINRKKYQAKAREEQLKIQALAQRKEALLSAFAAQIDKDLADYETARLRMELYQKQLKLTRAAIAILEADYSVQANNFVELLALEKDLLDYELRQLEAIVASQLARSGILRYFSEE